MLKGTGKSCVHKRSTRKSDAKPFPIRLARIGAMLAAGVLALTAAVGYERDSFDPASTTSAVSSAVAWPTMKGIAEPTPITREVHAARVGGIIVCVPAYRGEALRRASIIAIDATMRERGDGDSFVAAVAAISRRFPHAAIMADCAAIADRHARDKTAGPDVECACETLAATTRPVIVEHRLRRPAQVQEVFALGA